MQAVKSKTLGRLLHLVAGTWGNVTGTPRRQACGGIADLLSSAISDAYNAHLLHLPANQSIPQIFERPDNQTIAHGTRYECRNGVSAGARPGEPKPRH